MLTKILQKINEKGWNLYQINDSVENVTILNGPVNVLVENKNYKLLPAAKNPNSDDEVFEKFAIMVNKELFPLIKTTRGIFSISQFYIKQNEITVNIISNKKTLGLELSYQDFFEGLNTLVEFKY